MNPDIKNAFVLCIFKAAHCRKLHWFNAGMHKSVCLGALLLD